MVTVRSLERRWSSVLTPIFCCAASACSFSSAGSSSGSAESGSTGGSGTTTTTSGAATTGSSETGTGTVASGSASGGSSGSVSQTGTPVGGSGGSGDSTGGATGTPSGSGATGSSGSASTGAPAGGLLNPYCQAALNTPPQPCVKTTFKNFEITGTWPQLGTPLKTMPGKLVYTKMVLDTNFYAESCSIADYNGDGIPDVSAGRRWWQGPDFTTVHLFRGGHGALPRAGAPTELQNGVSDDWADYPWDIDGDGLPDIINIASCSYTEALTNTYEPMPQLDGTGYWYKNPGAPANTVDYGTNGSTGWPSYEISSDMKLEQKGIADVDGDGKPEIFASCHACAGGTKGYYEADWTNPKNPWAFHVVTRTYEFPFGGTGWQHGNGFGDIDGDGKPDLLERSGVWLQPATGWPAGGTAGMYQAMSWVPQAFSYPPYVGDNTSNQGGSHMFAFDVNGDGLVDVISADWAHGYGLAWYEQLKPGVKSCVGATTTATTASKNCFTKHQIINTNSKADLAAYPLPYNGTPSVEMSELHGAQLVDMDGDGLPDIVIGKMRFAHPYDQNDPDPDGIAYSFVFKLVRDATKPGGAWFEPHQIETGVTDTPALPNAAPPPYMAPVGSGTAYGVGRQVTVGHLNMDGIPDVCVSSKLGMVLYFGQ
jgi:hypothetical protein